MPRANAPSRSVCFVSQTPMAGRLVEVLEVDGLEVIVVSRRGNPLVRSKAIQRVVELDDNPSFSGALVAQILRGAMPPCDWVIYDNDSVLYELARSELSDQQLLPFLPCQKSEGRLIVGSKVGLARASSTLGLSAPRTVEAGSREELSDVATTFRGSFVIKGERGSSASQLVVAEPDDVNGVMGVPDAWFPVVIQEFVEGAAVSVEALFRDGALRGWLYSIPTSSTKLYGPSLSRRFMSPPALDFCETLNTLGQYAGFHGFFNCSFMWDPVAKKHLLIEADARPNMWHQFGPKLGVNWAELMTSRSDDTVVGQDLANGIPDQVRLFPRSVQHGMRTLSWELLKPWIMRAPGTWDFRNTSDQLMNRWERGQIIRTILRGLKKPLRFLGR